MLDGEQVYAPCQGLGEKGCGHLGHLGRRQTKDSDIHARFLSTEHLASADKGKGNLYAEAGAYLNPSFCWVITFNGTSTSIHLLYISFLSVTFDVACVPWTGKAGENSSWRGAVTTERLMIHWGFF